MFKIWWTLTVLLGAEFIHQTAIEWHELIFEKHLTISTNLFGTTFYMLVGLAREPRDRGAHVSAQSS